jgi:hypothetical protein
MSSLARNLIAAATLMCGVASMVLTARAPEDPPGWADRTSVTPSQSATPAASPCDGTATETRH